jgi:peptidyl-Lys metalloendopeptidase
MNVSWRRPRKLWFGCAAILPLLAACGSEPGEGGSRPAIDEQETDEARTANERFASDLSQLAVTLAASKTRLAASDALWVTVTLTNHASHPVGVLKWHTLLDGIHDPIFAVTRDGETVEYLGRNYKRPAPRAKDYFVMAAGESLTRTVDLAETYDLSATGNYTVRYRAEATDAKVGVVSNDVDVWLEGRPSPAATATPGEDEMTPDTQTAGFSGGCTSSEKTSLSTALTNAANYANGALNYLNGTPGSKPRYTTWFGAYTSSRWSTAKTHFAKLKDALDNKAFTLDCGCTDDAYAYVYSNRPYKVYLCNAFWSAPSTGTDSKAGTLIHETSHFTVVAGTGDHVYGKSACKSLAASNPAQALDNADSHEYFAENSPAQN